VQKRQFLQIALSLAPAGLLLAPGAAIPQVVDLNDAINKAGRQRMLSQRLVKTYMALGQKVEATAAESALNTSMALFDRQLVELKSFAPAPDIKATYAELEAKWGEFKAALVGAAPAKAAADRVLALSGQVLQLANQGTVQLEAVSGKPMGKLVNISGRQRMLSQRMAAFYLSASWGVQAPQSSTELGKARQEFLAAHEVLKAAPETTAPIKAQLALAETQFAFFEIALKTLQPGNPNPQNQANVFTTSERILQVMDAVTGMYAKVA
jgi:hypothetical protein